MVAPFFFGMPAENEALVFRTWWQHLFNFCQPSVKQKCSANFRCLHSLTSSRWANFKRDFTACQTPWPLWHLAMCWGILATTSKEQVAGLAEFLRGTRPKGDLTSQHAHFQGGPPAESLDVFPSMGRATNASRSHSATLVGPGIFGRCIPPLI